MENYELIEFKPKSTTVNTFPDYCSYDPEIYNKIVSVYDAGYKIQTEKWKWKPQEKTSEKFGVYTTMVKDVLETIVCPTLKDFNREIWDIFANFVEESAVDIIFFSPMNLKARNPEKPEVRYCDGMVFCRTHNEFLEIIERKNQNISRFLSLLVHFGYGCPQFRVITSEDATLSGQSGYSCFAIN